MWALAKTPVLGAFLTGKVPDPMKAADPNVELHGLEVRGPSERAESPIVPVHPGKIDEIDG